MKEELIFWRLAYFLIAKQGYQMIHLFENQTELWLEKLTNKSAPIIRLVQENLTWSTILQRDIEFTAGNGERVRKSIGKGELSVVNIYVSPHPPVDDYESCLSSPYLEPEGNKTIVHSIILAEREYEKGFQRISELLNQPVSIEITDGQTEAEVTAIKNAALQHSLKLVKEEKDFFANGKPFFTYLLIVIQVILYLWLELKGGSTNNYTLIKYGAKVNQLILDGEWWRFITPIFLHIGFIHLFMNTIALYYLGVTVEKMYGNVRFLFIYLFAGFTGVLASFIFSPNLSAGASGAIFGCFGALLYFGAINPKLFFRTMGMNLFFILALNLAFGFSASGIDNAGHLGGLLGGFLAAGIVYFPRKRKLWLQGAVTILSVVVLWFSLSFGFHTSAKELNESSAIILAQQYIKDKEYTKAYDILKDFKDKSSKQSERVELILGFVEIQRESYPEARGHLQKALKLDPNMSEAYYYLAIISYNENKIQQAKQNAEKAVELKSNDQEYQRLLEEINK